LCAFAEQIGQRIAIAVISHRSCGLSLTGKPHRARGEGPSGKRSTACQRLTPGSRREARAPTPGRGSWRRSIGLLRGPSLSGVAQYSMSSHSHVGRCSRSFGSRIAPRRGQEKGLLTHALVPKHRGGARGSVPDVSMTCPEDPCWTPARLPGPCDHIDEPRPAGGVESLTPSRWLPTRHVRSAHPTLSRTRRIPVS